MSLAILDAVAAPVGEPCFGAPSRYVASIANLPLIGHVFDELAEGGVDHALIIARAGVRRELEHVLDGGKSWGIEVSYAEAPDADGARTVLRTTSEALGTGPVIVYPADCLFPGQVGALRERFAQGDVDCVLLDSAPGASSPDQRMFATAVMLGPRTREVLDDSISRIGDSRGLDDILLARGYRVAMCEAAKQWFYNDSTERLLAANRMVLDDLPVPPVDGSYLDNTEIHGRVAISPGARVANSTVYGPVVIDADAIIEDSYIGPYTAIGRGARVSGTELDNSMVLAMAQIRQPGQRIEASIIGERASITRSFELPRGMHLRLEPDSRVILS